MAWIVTLSPAEELAVRMAFSLRDPWCRDDKSWQLRITQLQAQCIKSEEDRGRYEERAAKMARDIDGAVQDLKAQIAIPAAAPNTPS